MPSARVRARKTKDSPSQPRTRKERFASLDGLRGIALLLITLFHLWRIPGMPHIFFLNRIDVTPQFPNGSNGVLLFFVLSGFTLYWPLAQASHRGTAWPSWGNFFFRRGLRILPAYVLALALWTPLWVQQHGSEGVARFLIMHLTFTHTMQTDAVFSISGVLWAMGTIGQFYLLFPILATALRRWPTVTAGACFALCLLLRMRFAGNIPVAASLPGHLADFALGMFAAYLVTRWRSAAKPGWARVVWVVAALALIGFPQVYARLQLGELTVWSWQGILQTPLWAALVVGVVLDATPWTRVWSWKPLTWLGAISYSLFLYNYSMYWTPKWFFPGIPPNSACWWIVTFLSVIAVGLIGYGVAEWPLSRIREKARAESAKT